jgi:hypothetical protein
MATSVFPLVASEKAVPIMPASRKNNRKNAMINATSEPKQEAKKDLKKFIVDD